ncbi:MAG: hypothetical protein PVG93_00645, partial [Phycisphaerales bacterium]
QLSQLKAESEEQVADINEKLRGELAASEQKLADSQEQIEQYEKQLAQIKGECQESLTGADRAVQQQIDELRTQLQQSQTQHANEIEKLKDESQTNLEQVETRMQNSLEQAEEQLRQYQQKIDELQQKLSDAQSEMESQKQAYNQMQQELSTEQKARIEIVEIARRRADERDEVVAQLAELKEAQVIKPAEQPVVQTGSCDCCGADNISLDELTKIDSGHLFCSSCLAELRGD